MAASSLHATLHNQCFCGVCWHHKGVGLERTPQTEKMCASWTSACAQYLCQTFSSACYPRCTQEWSIPYREQSQGGFSAKGSSGFVSPMFLCGVSGRGRVEWCLGQGCLPALFLSCDGRNLTWLLRPPRSCPAHCRLCPHESWASTIWHVSSSWQETACSQRGRNRRIKGVSAMTVLSLHLVISWINQF